MIGFCRTKYSPLSKKNLSVVLHAARLVSNSKIFSHSKKKDEIEVVVIVVVRASYSVRHNGQPASSLTGYNT